MASTQTWNRYSYVLNNPINANDPSGHKCVGEVGECLAVGKNGQFTKPINGAGPKPPTYGDGKIGPPESPQKPKKEPSEEVKKQMQFCSEHPHAPECTIPKEDTLTQTPNHFTPIFPWQLSHLDAYGITGGITACRIFVCGTFGFSLIHNSKWNDEDTIFLNGGGGFGLGWGQSTSAGGLLAYDVEYNKDLAGGAANYGVNITPVKGGQVTYSVSDSPNVHGNYAQTYTISGSWGGEASGHAYQTFSIPLLQCGRLTGGGCRNR
jgi:hypothetical protein